MAFSPQSDKLAIAQSDNMVFVYKIGLEWGEKKSICNKFQHSSSISCLVWPTKRPNELAYGLAEGKVKPSFYEDALNDLTLQLIG